MRSIHQILFFILLCTGSICSQAQNQTDTTTPPSNKRLLSLIHQRQSEWIGQKFGAFQAVESDTVVTIQQLTGKVHFINFWFANCRPCLTEIDALNELHDQFKNSPDFEILSFTYEPADVIQQFVRKHKIHYRVLSVSEKDCRRLMINNGYPTNMILDKSGIVKYSKSGGFPSPEQANTYFRETLYPVVHALL